MSETTQGAASADPILDVDVAVIGAGVAGCYTAWRLRSLDKEELAPNSPLLPLLQRKDRLDVALFEYSDRLGGRLWSAAVNGIPNEFAEFGGMRFHKETHIVWNLIERLGLGPRAIPLPSGQPDNLVYLRRKHLRAGQVATHPEVLPYHFRDLEIGKTSAALLTYVCDTAIEGFSDLRGAYAAAFDANDWERVAKLRREYEARKRASKIGGRTVYDMSWWELQTALLSNEAFDFILESSGYDVTNTNGSAARSIDSMFYAGPWEYYRLSDGFEELPDALHKQFHRQGGATRLLYRLLRFDHANVGSAGGPYDLLFYDRRDARDSSFETTAAAILRRGEGCTRARAKLIVLAMPVRSLRLLDQDNFFFKPSGRGGVDRRARFDTAMDSVLTVPAFKLFVAYHRPWWEQTGVSKGQSVTDLPVRQCYYWATAPFGLANAVRNGVLMATYNNGIAVAYWQSLKFGKPFRIKDPPPAANDPFRGRAFVHMNWAAERLRGGAAEPADARAAAREIVPTATEAMVERAHAQLMEMHGVKYAPGPYDAHFQDWTVDPFGGGWHQWKSGSREDEYIPYMQQPMEEEQIFVVGECWSDAQGWVQGALNTSEAMLQDRLGLTWPQWLPRGGTWLGPRMKPEEG
jgi:lysine 2-monooxygenase